MHGLGDAIGGMVATLLVVAAFCIPFVVVIAIGALLSIFITFPFWWAAASAGAAGLVAALIASRSL